MNTRFTTFPYLETGRLRLRPLSKGDAAAVFRLRSDPEVAKLTGRKPAQHLDEARAFIEKIDRLVKENTSLYWAISYREKQDLIGTICIFNYDLKSEEIETGYELLPQYRRKGIMSEAITTIIDFALSVIGAKAVVACLSIHNSASINLLEKNGFKVVEYLINESNNEEEALLTYRRAF